MKRYHIHLPDPLMQLINDEAKHLDLTVSEVIRRRLDSGSPYRTQRKRARRAAPEPALALPTKTTEAA